MYRFGLCIFIFLFTVEKATSQVNEKLRIHDKFKAMLDISERLGNPDGLIVANRYLLHQGDIKKKDRRGDLTDRYLILFNNLLIEANYSGVQAYSDVKHIPLSVNNMIEIIDVTVEDHPHKEENPHDFIVKSPRIVRNFVAENAEAKQEWMEKLQAQIEVRGRIRFKNGWKS